MHYFIAEARGIESQGNGKWKALSRAEDCSYDPSSAVIRPINTVTASVLKVEA